MSSENIGKFVRKMLQENDSLSDPNNCRNSVSQIKNRVDLEFPLAKTDILVYPEARLGTGVHYSLLVTENDTKILINPVAAPGFPEYIGDSNQAFPLFKTMKITSEVI